MSIVLTGTKTVTNAVSPTLTGAVLTSLLAKAVEQLTVAELHQVQDAINRVSGGGVDGTLIGSLLT